LPPVQFLPTRIVLVTADRRDPRQGHYGGLGS
jgi:hypothetical protein